MLAHKNPFFLKVLVVLIAVLAALLFVVNSHAQDIPEEWHQPLTSAERLYVLRIINTLKRAPEFPEIKAWHVPVGTEPNWQLNAWEQNMEITVPVEMIRFLADDPAAFAFLLAHEAGHAKQQELYGSTDKAPMTTFDRFRSLGNIALGAKTNGASGAVAGFSNGRKQTKEDGADAWAVKFMRGAGLDVTGGIRMFAKLRGVWGGAWRSQFAQDHSINELRIAHVTALILKGDAESER